ncbi:uncharacterized protein LTR77_004878 [Saxophila tyrrhenica]|uniref:Uncharacterized protein n=1 Tax=Saxophila tyrrhenica TaxID=1690608 RepID=A0AAV9PAR6_9PEZI|nr:hypothetical protein LTR77_004878 [Saxophila tyrrhenica]
MRRHRLRVRQEGEVLAYRLREWTYLHGLRYAANQEPTCRRKRSSEANETDPIPPQLEGNVDSPIVLIGPLQGDSVDYTLFWLSTERTVVCGNSVVEEIETPQIYDAWVKTLDLIEALNPSKVIPVHIESGWELDAKADLAHNRKYLDLFASKVTHAKKKPSDDELFQTFKNAFPQVRSAFVTVSRFVWRPMGFWQAKKNLDFFLGHLSTTHGEGDEV